jgi:glucosamine--fructose-6-phosphate aminotransferase (isomerizing)
VASTKAFTTQITVLTMIALKLAKVKGTISQANYMQHLRELELIPSHVEEALKSDEKIRAIADVFKDAANFLYLGRGYNFPVALEGALKLKEISYIHAEAYPSGELKHGPLALVDADMPVVAVAPNNELLEKLKSNLHEVQARGGQLFVFADKAAGFHDQEDVTVVNLPHVPSSIEAIIYTLPLQLLSYHVAVLKGTDVDQPRNLAKSVTVE